MKKLENLHGKKIRRLYLSPFIYTFLSFLPMIPIMYLISDLKENKFVFSEFCKNMVELFLCFFIFIVFFAFLSLLNRLFFGKIIAVLNDDGIYLENTFLSLGNIQKIEYTPHYITKSPNGKTFATFFVKTPENPEYSIDVLHFPLYALFKIKKYNPEIEIKLSKDGIFNIWFCILMPIVLSVIISIIG